MRMQAVALLVHRDVSQVNALIEILRTSFDVYVHVDKKSDISLEEVSTRNVWKEYSVHWGGYNMVEATVFLYKQILSSGIPYTHTILLSGDSLPVKSNQYIAEYLNNYPGVSFIENKEADDIGLERVRLFWFNEDLRKRVRGVRKFLNSFRMIRWAQRRLSIWRSIKGFERTGSQWTILSLQHIRHLVKNCAFKKYRFMAVPDESFVQNHFTNFNLPYQRNLIYANWPKKRSLSPGYIDESTFLSLISSPYLFARKFRAEEVAVRRSRLFRLLQKIQGQTQPSRMHLQLSK
ncbi:MAG: hypothetical protein EOO01_15170 [Chitinophagaceae bacterium]|nr:MAG: hypothetical protein EOO01_15170 [Chitinophagaceae bacterium]